MLEQRYFRDILGQFTTGVVLVTTQTPRGFTGMAFNSFTSVSLNPPLVALCAAHTSSTWPNIREAGRFAVSILGAGQEQLCHTFSTHGAERFTGHDWERTHDGHPVPADALGWLDCRIETIYQAGDHELVVAEAVEGAVTDNGDPLVFHGGRITALPA
ncbi:NADH-FMN oxidoreductase RutF, flavin reductase (DIM6/NTAB) family [Actinopolyspora xinjiangensis]|uniref:NADH-FMN oxidoreductase RutF, flavin reductase (DIM6/NTAB) family n=1 Tax=Actinopolyspora xinjiangensis TaxID=405564 RepID=A0A1H0RFN6_9ACTN|nr:flavin reductase family protein [Actinopolyspora xinjiangensis]SDP28241.1 NADH-FMN oxidoreductase RutF, flavin reductase (DIM6/NTAB) family [Actinopolyspora xinjiangensis]